MTPHENVSVFLDQILSDLLDDVAFADPVAGRAVPCNRRKPLPADEGPQWVGLRVSCEIAAASRPLERVCFEGNRQSAPSRRSYCFRMAGDDYGEILREVEREIEAETARLLAEFEEAEASIPLGPISPDDEPDERERLAEVPGRDTPGPNGVIWRSEYVPKDEDSPYVKRDPDGFPIMRLVDAGDRLVIWSPSHDGGLINPRSPTLRTIGLIVTTVRGGLHRPASKEADLRKGRPVELRAEPDNPHGTHAVAVLAPGRSAAVGYVQRGRSRAVFDRIVAGEALSGICLRGSAPGREDWAAHILVGADSDLEAMTS